MILMGSGCHIFRIKKEPVEYARFIEEWLNDRDLNYDQLKLTYKGAYLKFNKETYEIKKKILEAILDEF